MQLPERFIERTKPLLGKEWNNFMAALQLDQPVSIRHNNKTRLPLTEPVAWCENGFYLADRPEFTLDPLLHAGCYYVQEASSMFLQEALKQHIPNHSLVLDMCAAPGGKSTLISQFLGCEGFLVSNEIVRSRSYVLAENLQKWGNGNAVVTNHDASHFGKFTHLFDAMLIDAPCSGEGMFRKDASAIQEWSESNVAMCAERQKKIIADLWEALKPGGTIIYSTCTYNQEENEQIVAWMVERFKATYLPVVIDPAWGVTESQYGYRFYPHKTKGEGFFLAVVRKPEESHRAFRVKTDKRTSLKPIPILKEVGTWLNNPTAWSVQEQNNLFYALPSRFAALANGLISESKVIMAGIALAEIKGKSLIPQPAIALSKHLNRAAFNTVEIEREEALNYLRHEAITLPHAPLGFLLVTYETIPMGWVKNIGNRCNNLYPNEWRIRYK